jgi:hypothetical protein
LLKAKSAGDRTKFRHEIATEEKTLGEVEAKYNALPCVKKNGGLNPRGNVCQAEKAALEKRMAETRRKIDQLRRDVNLFNWATQEKLLQKILAEIKTDEKNLGSDESKYNALPCVKSGGML